MISLKLKKMDIFEQFPALNKVPKENFPQFIFIIPDGNGVIPSADLIIRTSEIRTLYE